MPRGRKDIGKEAVKGGKARWKGSTKKERLAFSMKGLMTRWAVYRLKKEQKTEIKT